MNTRFLLCFLLLCGLFCPARAQEAEKIRVKGRVLDEQTNEPMAFVNIGLLGTTLGVASDMDGYFELAVAERYADYTLRLSAVGYASHSVKFRELQEKPGTVIRLKPVTYMLGEVEVTGSVDVIKRLLEQVVKEIPRNYIPRPYNYEGYFAHEVSVNGEAREKKEAIVLLHDKRGYARGDVAQAFADVNYTFTQVRRGKPLSSVAEGMIYFDDIVTADVVRHSRNVLDLVNYRDYSFKDKGKTLHDGDTVQVIAYECPRPTLSTTGDASALSYSGEIYIKLRDLAVIKHVARVTSGYFNPLGRNILPPPGARQERCTTTITTNYKKVSSYFFLGGISMVYSRESSGERVEGKMQYHTTGVRVDDLLPVDGRLYYEQMDTDYRFWDRYTLSLEEEE
ncbi:MAG: carboxypeptidase-like regulatory domain-containing protein [Odoribacteraceae bacterium]|nr:carboxypeptidase-like regulatory domain-containing protein [Odoribacteraceae bacterium]